MTNNNVGMKRMDVRRRRDRIGDLSKIWYDAWRNAQRFEENLKAQAVNNHQPSDRLGARRCGIPRS
jgi:hypothetical protein